MIAYQEVSLLLPLLYSPWTSVPVTDSMTDLPNDFGPVVEPSNPFNLSDLGLDLPAISTNNDTQSSNQVREYCILQHKYICTYVRI